MVRIRYPQRRGFGWPPRDRGDANEVLDVRSKYAPAVTRGREEAEAQKFDTEEENNTTSSITTLQHGTQQRTLLHCFFPPKPRAKINFVGEDF